MVEVLKEGLVVASWKWAKLASSWLNKIRHQRQKRARTLSRQTGSSAYRGQLELGQVCQQLGAVGALNLVLVYPAAALARLLLQRLRAAQSTAAQP